MSMAQQEDREGRMRTTKRCIENALKELRKGINASEPYISCTELIEIELDLTVQLSEWLELLNESIDE